MAKTYNPGRRLPNKPGAVPGTLKLETDPETRRVTAAFQCYDCHLVEEPAVWTLTTILFHATGGDGYRRCQPCRIKHRAANHPDCLCARCEEDLK